MPSGVYPRKKNAAPEERTRQIELKFGGVPPVNVRRNRWAIQKEQYAAVSVPPDEMQSEWFHYHGLAHIRDAHSLANALWATNRKLDAPGVHFRYITHREPDQTVTLWVQKYYSPSEVSLTSERQADDRQEDHPDPA